MSRTVQVVVVVFGLVASTVRAFRSGPGCCGFSAACLLFAAACGSSAGPGLEDAGFPTDAARSDRPEPAVDVDAAEPDLALEAPEGGLLLKSVGADIPPGEEREYCEAARLPGGPDDRYYVATIELANAPYSHHLGLAAAAVGSPAEAELDELGVGNRRECPGPLLAFGDGIEILGTTQVRRGHTALPEGVARVFHGGQFIVFNYHYFNPTEHPIKARSAASFEVVDGDSVERIAQLFSLNNVMIDVPPGQSASFTGECHFQDDMMVGGLTRHTHGWGTDFTVWFSGGERDGEEIWTSRDWEHETELIFEEPVRLRGGEGLRYRCTYENDTPNRIRFGTTVADEMCMLYGPVWPVDQGGALSLPDCNIVWVDGDGIGHPADEAGGFPQPSASNASLCENAYGDEIDPCQQCQCDECATPGLQCATDRDCNALLRCLGACTDLACTAACQSEIQDHSAGQGLLTVVAECVRTECPMCDSFSTAR